MAALEYAADERPALRIGCVADVQWADADDGWNYDRTNRRRYRGALAMLERAVAYWNRERCAFVAQLVTAAGYATTRAGIAAFLQLTELAWVYLLDVAALREPTSILATLGSAVVFVGAVAAVSGGDARATSSTGPGDLQSRGSRK